VKIFGLDLAVQAQPGTHHYLEYAVTQMGKTQAGEIQKLLPGKIQMKIIGHKKTSGSKLLLHIIA
jgi:hypothetical protein